MNANATRLSGDWRVSANCQHTDPNSLFARGRKQHDVKSICSGCPVLDVVCAGPRLRQHPETSIPAEIAVG